MILLNRLIVLQPCLLPSKESLRIVFSQPSPYWHHRPTFGSLHLTKPSKPILFGWLNYVAYCDFHSKLIKSIFVWFIWNTNNEVRDMTRSKDKLWKLNKAQTPVEMKEGSKPNLYDEITNSSFILFLQWCSPQTVAVTSEGMSHCTEKPVEEHKWYSGSSQQAKVNPAKLLRWHTTEIWTTSWDSHPRNTGPLASSDAPPSTHQRLSGLKYSFCIYRKTGCKVLLHKRTLNIQRLLCLWVDQKYCS